MWELVDRLSVYLLLTMLSAAILLSFVIVAMIFCRQPSRRRALARAGLLAVLLLPPLAAVRPSLTISVRPLLVSLATTVLSIRADARWDETQTQILTSIKTGLARPWALTLARALTVVYLGISVAALGSLVLGSCALGIVIRRAEAPSKSTRCVYEALSTNLTFKPPGLLVTSRIRRPVLAGFLQPIILIPPEMDRLADTHRLRLSLLHELAHARTRDTFFAALAAAARGLFFPLPQIWWISAQLRLDRELLADRRASVDFGGSLDYGSSLLDLAERIATPTAPGVVRTTSTAHGPSRPRLHTSEPSTLVPRLMMLVRAPFVVEATPPRWWRIALGILACSSTLIVSRFTLDPVFLPLGPSAENSLQIFTASRLEIPGGSSLPGQAQPPYALPLIMPVNFRLSARIFASDQALEEIELLGHRLSSPFVGPNLIEPVESPSWREVRLKRDGAQVDLWVDEHSVPANSRDTTERLIILPSEDESLLIEDLWVHW